MQTLNDPTFNWRDHRLCYVAHGCHQAIICLLLFSSAVTYCTCAFLYLIVTFGFTTLLQTSPHLHYFCCDMPRHFSVRNSLCSYFITCSLTSSACICLTHSLRSVRPYRPLNFSQQLLDIYNLSYGGFADRPSHYIYNWHSIHDHFKCVVLIQVSQSVDDKAIEYDLIYIDKTSQSASVHLWV